MKLEKHRSYIRLGLTAFLVIAASMLFFYIIFRYDSFSGGVKKFIGVFKPIIYGCAIAYILNPVAQFFENLINKLTIPKKKRSTVKAHFVTRATSVFIAVIIFGLLIYFLISLLLPQLVDSIKNIVSNYSTYEANLMNFVTNTFTSENVYATTEDILAYADKIYAWIVEKLPTLDAIASNVTSGFLGFLSFLKDFLLGIIIAIYVLISKEIIAAKGKRLLYSLFPVKSANRILHNLRFVDEKFGGFFVGKIIDSFIIGVLCYIVLSIMQMPYSLLISVIIGVTNIIPFFGPIIGAIPCAILVFVNSPIKSLYFVIFVILLQQFDGNILGPFIIGNSTGLSGLMIIVSILICNGLLGITGAFIGVPLFAILIGFIQSFVRKKIEGKGLPKDLSFYDGLYEIDETSNTAVEREEDEVKSSLYDRIKHKDKYLSANSVIRFNEKAEKKKQSNRPGSSMPSDPVNITYEEACSSKNIPIVK